MDLKIDRQWFEHRSELEGDSEIGAGIRKYLGQETTQDIVNEVSRNFAADLQRIFGDKPSVSGGTGPTKGEFA